MPSADALDRLDAACTELVAQHPALARWEVANALLPDGTLESTWSHPLSPGLVVVWPSHVGDVEEAEMRRILVDSVASSAEVRALQALPASLAAQHRSDDDVLPFTIELRLLARAFEWQAHEAAGVAGLLEQFGVVAPDEAAWFTRHAAPAG